MLVLEIVVGVFAAVADNAFDAEALVDCTLVFREVLLLWPLVNGASVDLESAAVEVALNIALFVVDFTDVVCDAVEDLPLVNVTTEVGGEVVVVW